MRRFIDFHRAMGEGFGVGRETISTDHIISCFIVFPSCCSIRITWEKEGHIYSFEERLASEHECLSRYNYISEILEGTENPRKYHPRWDFGETEDDAKAAMAERIRVDNLMSDAVRIPEPEAET